MSDGRFNRQGGTYTYKITWGDNPEQSTLLGHRHEEPHLATYIQNMER
jgi:hypothetical protein